MSMMEPDDAEWMPADDPAAQGMHGGWMNADQYDERVWGLPPRPPPGVRPPTGQLPGRPVWPFWGYWGYRLRNAQRDIKYLAEVVNDILDARLDQLTMTGLPGVTDGTEAAPGAVGEFLWSKTTVAFPAYSPTASVDTTVNGMTLPPGDWDIALSARSTTYVGNMAVDIGPVPTGMPVGPGIGASTVVATTEKRWDNWSGGYARGLFSVPTLIPLHVRVWQNSDPSLVAGNLDIYLQARRRR